MNYKTIFIVLISSTLLIILLLWILVLVKRSSALKERVLKNEKEKVAILSFLEKMGSTAVSLTNIEETLSIILDFFTFTTNAEAGAIFLLEKDGITLSAKVVQGLFPPLHNTQSYVLTKRKYLIDKIKKDRIKVGEGIIGYVAKTGEALLITDAQNDSRVPKFNIDFLTMDSLILSPLKIRNRILGVFAVVNKQDKQKFNEDDMELLKSLANQAAVTVNIAQLYEDLSNKQRLEQELKIAYEFQKMLLPKECPKTPFLEIGVYSNPALEVGGDYYDFFWVDGDKLGVVIADVSGKGIPGALIMSMVRSTLRAESIGRDSPKEVLCRVNERVLEDTKENVFITMTYGIIDFKKMNMKFVRAGHEPTILLDEQEQDFRLYTPEGIALGLVPNSVFDIAEEVELDLNPGITTILYTDGVIEAMNDQNEEYGKDRFLDVIRGNIHQLPDEIINEVVNDIHNFTKGIEQHDDITLVAIKVMERAPVAQIA